MRRCCSPRPTRRPPRAGSSCSRRPTTTRPTRPRSAAGWRARSPSASRTRCSSTRSPAACSASCAASRALAGLELHHTARLLRWGVYARRCEGPLPRYDAVAVVEPLHPGHARALAGLSGNVAPLALPAPAAAPGPPPPGAPWLVVHSGPAREVRALAREADERRGGAPLHVVTPIAVDGLPAGAEMVRAIPAAPRYAGAAGIVTAAGFNTVRELAPYRERHVCVPFDRRLDDQPARWLRLGASGPEV